MLNINKTAKNFVYILIANFVTLFSGIVTSFIMPRYMGLIEFGYWQLFVFYAGYTGLFQLGFNDGIYVLYGGKNFNELPREKFRAYFVFLIYFQIVVSTILVILSIFLIEDSSRRIIFIFVSINTIILGLITYFVFINQATKRFGIVSLNTVLSKVMLVIAISVCILTRSTHHHIFIVAQTIINLCVLIIYIFNAREIVIGKRSPLKASYKDIVNNITIGFFIMAGNFMGFLTIGAGRFLVDRLFDMKDFAIYSFATSLLNMIFVVVEAITTTVYPYLSNVKENYLTLLYERYEAVLAVTAGFSMSAFFVLKVLVLKLLPQYSQSLNILLLLFPTVMFRTNVSVLSSNYYKVLKEKNAYTMNNAVAFAGIMLISLTAFAIKASMVSIAIAVTVSSYLWMLYSDYFFYRKIGISFIKVHIYQIFGTLLLIFTGLLLEWYLGLAIYIIFNLILVKIFYQKDVQLIYKDKLGYFKGENVFI